MHIVSVLGSPRQDGNSNLMTRWVMDRATGLGATASQYALNEMDFQGCQACWKCKGVHEGCVLEDDLSPVLDETARADALIMSTPVFYGDVTAQLKAFIDRTFSYLVPKYYRQEQNKSRLAPGKKLLMVIAQGYPDPGRFDDIFGRYAEFFQWMGFTHTRQFRACGVYFLGDANKRREALENEAEEAARWLVGEGE